jgi:hypothetical protein
MSGANLSLTKEQLEKLRPPFFTGNLTVNNTNGTTYLELDEDQVSPGFAVLLMYLMLVRGQSSSYMVGTSSC